MSKRANTDPCPNPNCQNGQVIRRTRKWVTNPKTGQKVYALSAVQEACNTCRGRGFMWR